MMVPWNISPWEVVNLLLMFLLVPLTIGTVRDYRVKARYLLYGYLTMALAGVLSVLEHPFLPATFLTDVKNVLFAIASILFAIGAFRLRAAVERREV